MNFYLGGELDMSSDDISLLENEYRQGQGPTNRLISEWSHKNPTIKTLFLMLHKLGMRREMETIKQYGKFARI